MDDPTPLETQDTARKASRFLLPASVLIILLVSSIEAAIRGLPALDADATVTGLREQSTDHLGNLTTELETVNKCAPFCHP
jgi:hypothetical protein